MLVCTVSLLKYLDWLVTSCVLCCVVVVYMCYKVSDLSRRKTILVSVAVCSERFLGTNVSMYAIPTFCVIMTISKMTVLSIYLIPQEGGIYAHIWLVYANTWLVFLERGGPLRFRLSIHKLSKQTLIVDFEWSWGISKNKWSMLMYPMCAYVLKTRACSAFNTNVPAAVPQAGSSVSLRGRFNAVV